MIVGAGPLVVAILAIQPVPDVELPRPVGQVLRLSEYAAGRPVVVVLLGVDCPVANLYAPRLRELAARLESDRVPVLAVIPSRHDSPAEVAAFAREHCFPFPCLLDSELRLADALHATRTPQAFVLDGDRRVRYRGRIDDQYNPGGTDRPRPTREDLYEAAHEVATGRPVTVPATPAVGCPIGRRRAVNPAAPTVTFARDVGPLLRDHCQSCHRPGEVGPFPLLTYADARRRAGAIAEAVADGRMPPWHASAAHGRFRNDRSLTDRQKRVIAEWVRLGCPEGESAEPPAPPADSESGWEIGTPDVVYPIPAPFDVPEQGAIEYQYFLVDPGLTRDAWVQAAEIRPGNRRVVHHCNVFLMPPDCTDPKARFETGSLRSSNLVAWTPGSGPVRLPAGMAKLVPAGHKLQFVIHYTPVGSRQTDRTELGLKFCPPADVRAEVGTQLLEDPSLVIPPHTASHRVERTWRADQDVLLLSMFPHMHLRGKSFRYTAEFPDGTQEVLLDVPAYDFDWQHRYELVEPRRLPAGTVIRCSAEYDNSAGNPVNPDPAATVRDGLESTDEMFNGFFDIAVADQDFVRDREVADAHRRRRTIGWTVVAAALAGGLLVRQLIRRKPTASSA